MGTKEKLLRQKLADQIEKLLTQSEKVFTTQKLSSEWLESMIKETHELGSRLTIYKFLYELQDDENLQIEFLELEEKEAEAAKPNIPNYGDEILKEIDEFEQSDAEDVEIVENEIEFAKEITVEKTKEKEEKDSKIEPVSEQKAVIPEQQPSRNQEDEKQAEINDLVSDAKNSLADKLRKKPIQKLAESIALNERFLFSNELFNGNMESFKRALNELDHVATIDDARRFIEIQLKEQHEWKMDSEIVQSFVLLVERRFN